MNGLKDGVNEKINSVKDAIQNGLNGVIEKAKGILDLFSPSRVFANMGEDIMAGLAKGIGDGTKLALDSMSVSMDAVAAGAASTTSSIINNSEDNRFSNVNVTFEGSNGQEQPDEAARLMNTILTTVSATV